MTYAETAQLYVDAGWGVPFPLPAGRKHPPPDGVTGQHGEDLPANFPEHRVTMEGQNYGLRMPVGVMGMDVDVYGDKHGDVVLAGLEARLGPLPAGPWSSSRAWPSGIRFFRLPAGRETARLAGVAGPGIEVIQRHHRYAVVWPSVVEGREYHWRTPELFFLVPDVADLPELPGAWVDFLAEGASEATGPSMDASAIGELEVELFSRAGVCSEVAGLLADADARMAESAEGGRHDAMLALAFRLAHLAVEGHLSWGAGAEHLGGLWEQYVADGSRSGEFARIMRTALGKTSGEPAAADPCAIMGGLGAGPSPVDAEAAWSGPPVVEPAPAQEIAGVRVFDPLNAYDDRALALAVLGHVGEGVRFLLDSGGWLRRGAEAWTMTSESRLDGARSLVAEAVRTLPHGRKDAEDGSDEKTRHLRHKTLTSTAGLGRVAGYLAAEVGAAGGALGVRLSDLDAEPEQLWAGGVAWDLRTGERADVDPRTPHQRAAATAPVEVRTPLWDAFTAQVWPDAEQRAWALRVLAIGLTGYADRAMPILWGPRGRGKTQVLALLSDVLGSYAVAADPRLLGSGETHGSVILALAGARLAWVDEGPRNGHLATERLKALTGGGAMTGNPMRGNPVTFQPTHTLCLTSNDEPQVADEALRSRVRSIECTGELDGVRRARLAIGNVRGSAWRAERPGVLAAMMRHARTWLEDPTSSDNPVSVEAMLEALAREQDPVLAWLDDRTSTNGWTPSTVLYEDYRLYCMAEGVNPRQVASAKQWGRQLSLSGVLTRKGAHGVRVRDRVLLGGGGVKISTPPEDPANATQEASVTKVTLTTEDALRIQGPAEVASGGVNPPSGGVTGGVTGGVRSTPETPSQSTKVALGGVSSAYSTKPNTHIREITREATTEANPGAKPEVNALTPPTPPEALRGTSAGLPAVVVRDAIGQEPQVTSGAAWDVVKGLLGTLANQSVTLDVEHSGYPIGHPDYVLRTIQLGTAAWAVVLDAADPAHVRLAGQVLVAASEIVAHASQADVIPVAMACQLVDPGIWWAKVTDTAVLGALADPHLTGTDKGHALDLKRLSGRMVADPVSDPADKARAAYFRKGKWLTNTTPTTPAARSGWAQADYAEPVMARYAASDVLDTAALRAVLPDLRATPKLEHRERRVLAQVARISQHGMRLDREWTLAKHAEATRAKTEMAEQLVEMGVPDPASTAKLSARFADLGADLKRTKTGQLSTDKKALAAVLHQEGEVGDLARAVTDWRAEDTVLKLLLTPYRELVLRGDGRARPTVQTLGAAATGRMSTVRPNLQQVSKVGGVRGCIVADPGYLLVSADFSSVEVRVAAALAHDEQLAMMIREGLDMHGRIAGLVWGTGYTKAQRYAVKSVVFAKMYGSGKGALAAQLGPDGHRVDDVIDSMEQVMPGFAQWASRLQQEVRTGLRPVWRHPSGRLTYLPSETPHKAPNYAIQSTSRELLVDALERWEAVRPGHTLLPIHDEVLVQVPEDQAEQAALDLVGCMTSDLLGVPIVAEASTPTDRWQDAS